MLRTVLAAASAAAAAVALVPAPASADATCSLQFDVAFDSAGWFSQVGAGEGICAGNIAGVALDPGSANPAIAGRAASGGSACAPRFEFGRLDLRPRRMLEFWGNEHLELEGQWLTGVAAPATALRGTVVTDGSTATLLGEMRFVPAAGECAATGFARGRLHVDLLLGNEQPAPRSEPAAEPAPAPSAAAKARPAARKPCKRRAAKSSKAAKRRAVKRCKRARRRS